MHRLTSNNNTRDVGKSVKTVKKIFEILTISQWWFIPILTDNISSRAAQSSNFIFVVGQKLRRVLKVLICRSGSWWVVKVLICLGSCDAVLKWGSKWRLRAQAAVFMATGLHINYWLMSWSLEMTNLRETTICLSWAVVLPLAEKTQRCRGKFPELKCVGRCCL